MPPKQQPTKVLVRRSKDRSKHRKSKLRSNRKFSKKQSGTRRKVRSLRCSPRYRAVKELTPDQLLELVNKLIDEACFKKTNKNAAADTDEPAGEPPTDASDDQFIPASADTESG